MISQIIYTIIMALGVASGTKATGNTFYDANKSQPIKKAITEIDDSYDVEEIQHYRTTTNTTNDTHYIKYILKDNNDTKVNILTDYGLLTNTIYEIDKPIPNSTVYETTYYTCLKFNNYASALLDIKLYTELWASLDISGTASQTIRKNCSITTDTTADQLIDLTMTASTENTILNLINNEITWDEIRQQQQDSQYVSNNQVNEYRNLQEDIYVAQNESKFVLLRLTIFTAHTTAQYTDNQSITINGSYNSSTINYEIVDIPGIMFTVLTMPFSFISTAFNLTIFPNTPYQINFANLFMVILATFVLMYLIKKVFK